MRRFLAILLVYLGCLPRFTPDSTHSWKPSALTPSHSLGESGTQLGQFRRPVGICLDVEGHIYVADSGNRRILRFDQRERAISEYRGEAAEGFEEATGIASDGFYVYVADFKRGEVVRVDPEKHLSLVVSRHSEKKISPWGIGAASTGEVYVSDRENSQILIFDQIGRLRDSFGRYGEGPGEFRRPSGIGVDGMRRVYVCDPERRVIEIFDPLGGHLSSLRLDRPPVDVDIDVHGNLFVASPNWISVVDNRGEILRREGPRTPGAILVRDEKLYLTDSDSDRVLIFDILYSEE